MDNYDISVTVLNTNLLADEELYQSAYEKSSIFRRQKADKLKFKGDKRACIGGEILLVRELDRRGLLPGIRQSDLSYIEGEQGKPYISGHTDIFFNISHSGDFVVCALADGEIGCDIEVVHEVDFKIAERFFAPKEIEAIRSRKTEAEKQDMFFRLWTLKESFIKVTGMGLAIPLNEFTIDILEEGIITVDQDFDNHHYHFRELDLIPGYRLSVCLQV